MDGSVDEVAVTLEACHLLRCERVGRVPVREPDVRNRGEEDDHEADQVGDRDPPIECSVSSQHRGWPRQTHFRN
jgi:hypothetical protein